MYNQDINLHKLITQAPAMIPGMRPSHLYPSSTSVKINVPGKGTKVYGGCNRLQYLRYLGEAPSDFRTDSESLGVFTAGDQIQDIIEERFKRAGVFVQSELPMYIKEHNVSGRIDTIIKDAQDQFYGVEIKSKCGYWAQTHYITPTKSSNPVDFRPADEHILQSMVYMHAFNTQPHLAKYKIKKWLVLYILRDTYDYNYFELELTDESYSNAQGTKKGAGYPIIYSKVKPEGFVYSRLSMNDIEARWTELNKDIKNVNLPARDFNHVYTPELLQIMNNNGEFAATISKKVSEKKYAQVTQMNGDVKEPLGDKACMYCEFRSKCWGLGSYKENDFTN